MQRRRLLAVGLVSAAVVALGGGALALLEPGLREGRLTERGRAVMAGLSRGFLDGSLPADAASQRRAIDDLLPRIDALIGALPPPAQAELSQLLALLASAGGRVALTGLAMQWHSASVADIQQALQGMRVSRLALRQQSYQALHDIVGSAYFSDSSTWSVLGYPGPLQL